jgi:hypothetical protein
MPKAAVHKNREPLMAKNEIGPPRQPVMSPPASNPVSAQNCRELQLSIFVAHRADRSHYARTLRLSENIGHSA